MLTQAYILFICYTSLPHAPYPAHVRGAEGCQQVQVYKNTVWQDKPDTARMISNASDSMVRDMLLFCRYRYENSI